MDRRTFLQATAVPIGAGALSTLVPETLSAIPSAAASQRPSVVVIGAGAFGVWTALHLRERGHTVTLVDAYGPGSSRATSGDETRQLRVGYGDRELYARMAQRAYAAWRARESEFGVSLMVEAGRLELSPDWTPSLRATHEMLGRLGVPVEALTPDEMRRRWPQINVDGMGLGVLEPTAAVLRAKQSIIAAGNAFARKGGQLMVQRARPGRADGRRLVDVELASGERVSAERFVFACGPWLPKVFPQLLGTKIKVPGREVFYFGLPSGDTRFNVGSMPNFSEDGYYGFPSLDGRGVKVCPTTGPITFDPDTDERMVTPHELRRARAYLARRFPALANQPITETRVCQLENTPEEHFIIDWHPEWENVLIAGGGSGHAFKHGPVLGEYVGQRAVGEKTDPAFDQMVRLAN